MKYFLLIAGECYYPSEGTEDWIKCYETQEEAQKDVVKTKEDIIGQSGQKKGKIIWTLEGYVINGKKYDWYEIVDLRDWIS